MSTVPMQESLKNGNLTASCTRGVNKNYTKDDGKFKSTQEFIDMENERNKAKPDKFDESIWDHVIDKEVGDDAAAKPLLQQLRSQKLYEIPSSYTLNANGMAPENREKFKELLLMLAPIIKVGHPTLSSAAESSTEEEFLQETQGVVNEIVAIWGGNAEAINYKLIQHPSFCFKALAKMAIDLEKTGSGKLYQSFDCMAVELMDEKYSWPGDQKGEKAIYRFARSLCEDEGGYCDMQSVFPNW